MNSKAIIRPLVYVVASAGQTLALGIKDGPMTWQDWARLVLSSLVAAAVTLKALYDQDAEPLAKPKVDGI